MKHKKILIIIIVIAILMVPIVVLAEYSGINTTINGLGSIGKGEASQATKDKIESMLGIFQVIGSIISVVALSIIGIRYMISSVEEKASMKGVVIYYVIGAVLVFATSNVLGIVFDVVSDFNHRWVSTITLPATCTTPGSLSSVCEECGKTKEETILPKGHQFNGWTTETEATCVVLETQKRSCTRSGCSYSETRTVGQLAPHQWEHYYLGGNANIVNKCTVCALECNHDGKMNTTTTYEQAGHLVKTECKNCQAVIEDNILSHYFNSNTGFCECGLECSHSYENGICTICGMQYNCASHNWNNGRCTICDLICSHTNISLTYSDAGTTCYYENRCQTCGQITSDGPTNADHSSSETCSCGHTHNYVSGVCVCGRREGPVCEHPTTSYQTIDCVSYCYWETRCSSCGELIGDGPGYNHYELSTDCSYCGHTHNYISGVCACGRTGGCNHPTSSYQAIDAGAFCYYEYRCQTCGEITSDGMGVYHNNSFAACSLCGHTHSFVSGACSRCGYKKKLNIINNNVPLLK